jgi:hypothetical protein
VLGDVGAQGRQARALLGLGPSGLRLEMREVLGLGRLRGAASRSCQTVRLSDLPADAEVRGRQPGRTRGASGRAVRGQQV